MPVIRREQVVSPIRKHSIRDTCQVSIGYRVVMRRWTKCGRGAVKGTACVERYTDTRHPHHKDKGRFGDTVTQVPF